MAAGAGDLNYLGELDTWESPRPAMEPEAMEADSLVAADHPRCASIAVCRHHEGHKSSSCTVLERGPILNVTCQNKGGPYEAAARCCEYYLPKMS